MVAIYYLFHILSIFIGFTSGLFVVFNVAEKLLAKSSVDAVVSQRALLAGGIAHAVHSIMGSMSISFKTS